MRRRTRRARRDRSVRRVRSTVAALRPIARTAVVAIVAGGLGACTALNDYSVRMAERSCQDVPVCTIEGPQGKTLSPCMYGPDGSIYPGDSRWPYTTPGVCDVVVDGKVTSSRELAR